MTNMSIDVKNSALAVEDARRLAKLKGFITENDLNGIGEEYSVSVGLVKRLHLTYYGIDILDLSFLTDSKKLNRCIEYAKTKFGDNAEKFVGKWRPICGSVIESNGLGTLVYVGSYTVPEGMLHYFIRVEQMNRIALSWSMLRELCPDFDPSRNEI